MAKRGVTDEEIARKLHRDLEESDIDLSEEDIVDDSDDDDVDYVQEEVGSSDSEEESRYPCTSAASNPIDIVPEERARLTARRIRDLRIAPILRKVGRLLIVHQISIYSHDNLEYAMLSV
ncbi:uncharacterized protein LOC126278354 [Schistocerca gregaria]|uniref:uncharacterized protein LOC126278354 n=1 Tax=Schistocerca gregaria TaxID=7010 RepID=UPI00211E853B|nr:uncharacterized protein LOC126278354 [Schistocerca gregaria]